MGPRTIQSDIYRYGFNGKEKDENGEWGSQTHYDYGFRVYNPGIGKFLSVDPLTASFPWYTPYQFAGNMPVWAIDLDGLEVIIKNRTDAGNEIVTRVIDTHTLIQQSPGMDNYDNNVIDLINKDKIIITLDFEDEMARAEANLVDAVKLQNRRRQADRDFAAHKARMSNPVMVAYEISDVNDYVTATTELLQGNPKAAAVTIGISLLPEIVEQGSKVIKKAAQQVPSSPLVPSNPTSTGKYHQPGYLPDDANVVRGGTNTAERFEKGSGVVVNGDGTLSGVSVNSKPGATVKELSQKIPNNQVGHNTVGEIRNAGGDVIPRPTPYNPNHALMEGVTSKKAEELMTPTIKNPAKDKN